MSVHEERLKELRAEMERRQLDGFVVPMSDEHMSEYVGGYAQRLAWLTGFGGSAGSAIVLLTEAVMFVDGRYTLQVREEVDSQHWTFESIPQTNTVPWLAEHSKPGMRVGYDPWLHSQRWVVAAQESLRRRGAELYAVADNPVDAVWKDRPNPSLAEAVVYPEKIAGSSSSEKRRQIAGWLKAKGADAVVLTALDSIAWTFNLRGNDIEHTPVVLAYAMVQADGTADLFVATHKITSSVVAHLGSAVRIHPRDSFAQYLKTLSGKKIAVDPDRAVGAVFEGLISGGAAIIEARDPIVLPKAIKNSTEIANHRAAQRCDGGALSRFFHWLELETPKGHVTELSAADRLQKLREDTDKLLDLSFDTISGFGPNGAVVHYRVSEQSSRKIEAGNLYLVDSGGQYAGATTDVTRTVAIGQPNAEMRDRFTRVLKGHIAIAKAVFPAGTRGGQLDVLARQYLWEVGLDFAHATGHGVGAYLGVHEEPQRIHKRAAYVGLDDEPLVPGMILSNEPGYYKAGEYGIRIESLLLVVTRPITGSEQEMLSFETLTLVPIDRKLIDISILTSAECDWVDSYHADVARIIGPKLDEEAKRWLLAATGPLK